MRRLLRGLRMFWADIVTAVPYTPACVREAEAKGVRPMSCECATKRAGEPTFMKLGVYLGVHFPDCPLCENVAMFSKADPEHSAQWLDFQWMKEFSVETIKRVITKIGAGPPPESPRAGG